MLPTWVWHRHIARCPKRPPVFLPPWLYCGLLKAAPSAVLLGAGTPGLITLVTDQHLPLPLLDWVRLRGVLWKQAL